MPQSPEPSTVAVSELRSAIEAILDAAEVEFGPTIELDADHYWLLESSDSFDLRSVPTIHAGQLTDDLASIRSMLANDEVVVWHDLDHLVGLLRRVSALARA